MSPERHARLQLFARQAENFAEPPVDDLQAAVLVEQAEALRHVVERRIETQVDALESFLLLLEQADVAAHHDRAAVAGAALAHAQPAPVVEPRLAGRRQLRLRVAFSISGPSCAIGVPGRSKSDRRAQEVGRLRIGEREAAIGVDQHDAFARVLQRVGKPHLRGAALLHLSLHHRLDVVAHQPHGGEQRAKFIGAALRNFDVELAACDLPGRRGSRRHRPDDAPRQQPRHGGGDQQREQRAAEIEVDFSRHRRARSLAIEEGVARSVVDQQVDLLLDDGGVVVERVPVDVGFGAGEQAQANVVPVSAARCTLAAALRRTLRLRALRGDLQVLR